MLPDQLLHRKTRQIDRSRFATMHRPGQQRQGMSG